jgi:hypothetical protein
MTGREIEGPGDAVWDDGEWISWDWINEQLNEQETQERFPEANLELIRLFDYLRQLAIEYREVTGRHLPIYGELGELFAEITFGITRHKQGSKGADGRLGKDYIEIKTISPEKSAKKVQVRRKSNFNKLLVVKIDEEYQFEARMLDRKQINKGKGKLATVGWTAIESEG